MRENYPVPDTFRVQTSSKNSKSSFSACHLWHVKKWKIIFLEVQIVLRVRSQDHFMEGFIFTKKLKDSVWESCISSNKQDDLRNFARHENNLAHKSCRSCIHQFCFWAAEARDTLLWKWQMWLTKAVFESLPSATCPARKRSLLHKCKAGY